MLCLIAKLRILIPIHRKQDADFLARSRFTRLESLNLSTGFLREPRQIQQESHQPPDSRNPEESSTASASTPDDEYGDRTAHFYPISPPIPGLLFNPEQRAENGDELIKLHRRNRVEDSVDNLSPIGKAHRIQSFHPFECACRSGRRAPLKCLRESREEPARALSSNYQRRAGIPAAHISLRCFPHCEAWFMRKEVADLVFQPGVLGITVANILSTSVISNDRCVGRDVANLTSFRLEALR